MTRVVRLVRLANYTDTCICAQKEEHLYICFLWNKWCLYPCSTQCSNIGYEVYTHVATEVKNSGMRLSCVQFPPGRNYNFITIAQMPPLNLFQGI